MDNIKEIKIGDKFIGGKNPVYIIAEAGLNHQGDIKLAKKLVDAAMTAGCDCIKFQKRSLEHVYTADVLKNPEKQEHGIHYLLTHIKKSELSDQEMTELNRYCKTKKIDFLCTPWDEHSVEFLYGLNVSAYKIGSPDMFNFKLIQAAASKNKSLIISTGMSFLSEVDQLVNFLRKINAQFVLLHCNSTYPAPYHDINLSFIKTLQERFQCVTGYSGHESGISTCLAAVSLGAKIIERHITLDRNLPGPDHRASLEPSEFADLVREIRVVEASLGNPVRFMSRGEYLNREALSKSLVAGRDLKKGSTLKYDDIALKSPGKGTNPLKLEYFIGKKLVRSLKKDDFLLESDVNMAVHEKPKPIKLKHKWGVVARMSDIDSLLGCGSDFVEIHLTDVDINENRISNKKYNVDLVVHGPEYNGDLLLNLSSLDQNIRERSIEFFNKALTHARKLKSNFKNKTKPVKFIVHPGGMNMEKPLLSDIKQLNKNLVDSLKKLDGRGLELLVENMPGCPWYFGGQWFHASFMDSKEIVDFSKKTGYGITFDTSHAALYCNFYNKSLEEFTKTILPVTKYIHISDASNFNGEGLQIGDGNSDFKMLLHHIIKKDLWILPEIWQGHKFGGEKFLIGLRNLKEINEEL